MLDWHRKCICCCTTPLGHLTAVKTYKDKQVFLAPKCAQSTTHRQINRFIHSTAQSDFSLEHTFLVSFTFHVCLLKWVVYGGVCALRLASLVCCISSRHRHILHIFTVSRVHTWARTSKHKARVTCTAAPNDTSNGASHPPIDGHVDFRFCLFFTKSSFQVTRAD